MKKQDSVILTGASGFIGSNIQCKHPIPRSIDLTDYPEVLASFLHIGSADGIIHCAAKHGSNEQMRSLHSTYVSNNLISDINVLRAARASNIKNVLCISSITAIPPSPKEVFTEDDLHFGQLNSDIFGYSWSKKATVSICKSFQLENPVLNYKAVLLGNAYGPGCKFHDKAPVIANLIHQIGSAMHKGEKSVSLYGDGQDIRSFIYVKDLDRIFKDLLYDDSISGPIIISSMETTSVRSLAFLIAEEMQYKGDVLFSGNTSKNVQKKKVAKSNLIDMNKYSLTSLKDGIRETIRYYNNL